MNEKKLKQLFAAARASAPAEPPSNFPARVLGAIMSDVPNLRRIESTSVLDQFHNLFPRLATAALAVMALALILGLYFSDDLTSQLAQVSNEWLLPVNWL